MLSIGHQAQSPRISEAQTDPQPFPGMPSQRAPIHRRLESLQELREASDPSYRSRKTPRLGEKPVAWHAVLVVGYNDKDRRFILRNSWGKNWGLKGYFTLPYEYLLDSDLSKD